MFARYLIPALLPSLLMSFGSFATTRPVASICGYVIVQEDPAAYTIGRLATTGAFDPSSGRFYFPTVTSVSVPDHGKSYLMNVFDGVMQTGAARFSEGIIRPMAVDIPAGSLISDLAILSVPQKTAAGVVVSPVTGIVEGTGSIRLFFSGATQAATHLIDTAPNRGRARNFSYELDNVSGEPFRSLAMVKISASDANLRIFGLTDNAVYQLDVHTDGNLDQQLMERSWKRKFVRARGRYLRAAGPNTIVVGDEHSTIDVWHHGKLRSLGKVSENWLIGFDAFVTNKNELRILTLSSAQKLHFYNGVQFEPVELDFSEDEIPIAISTTYLRDVDANAWDLWKARSDYNTGHLSERVHDTARRIILLTRKGADYQVRGVQGIAANELRLSNFPWFYVSEDHPPLVKDLIQAGFKLEKVSIDVRVDIGKIGEKIATRLREEHGFNGMDPKHPERSKGLADAVANAWRNRLSALRDLRLAKAQVSESIAQEGIHNKYDQLLVYELMALEEAQRMDAGIDIEDSPDSGPEWLALFQLKLADTTTPLVQPMPHQAKTIAAFYNGRLKDRRWDEVEQFDITDASFETMKPLYLLSRQYFNRPFKYLVADFLKFCNEVGYDRTDLETEIPVTYWMALADYLDARDPLRKVVDEVSLLKFLLGK